MFKKRAMHLLMGVFTFFILFIVMFSLPFSNSKSTTLNSNTLEASVSGQHSYYIKDYDTGANASMAIVDNSFGEEELYVWGLIDSWYTEDTDETIEDFFVLADSFTPPNLTTPYDTIPLPIRVVKEDEFKFNDEELEGVEISEYNDRFLITTKDSEGNEHIYLWGTNLSYFGLESTVYRPTELVLPDGYNNIKSIGFKNKHNISLVTEDENGRDHLFIWGDNSDGLFNYFTTDETMEEPVEIILPEDEIKYVEVSNKNVMVVTSDNYGKDHLYMWGDNSHRQVNFDGDEFFYYEPQEIKLSSGEVKGIALIDDESIDITEYYSPFNDYGAWNQMNGVWDNPDESRFLDQFLMMPIVLIEENGHNYFYAWGEYLMYKDMDIEQLHSKRFSSIEKFEYDTFKNQEILDFQSSGGTYMFLTEDSSQKNHVYLTGANGTAIITGDDNVWYNPSIYYWDFYDGEFFERELPSNNIKKIEVEHWISSAVVEDENGNDVMYLWGTNQQYSFSVPQEDFGNEKLHRTNSDENYALKDEYIIRDSGSSTSFYNNDLRGKEFSFVIKTNLEFDPSKISVYNQDMDEMEEVTFVEQNGDEYLFEVNSGSRMYVDDLYWSYDDGETLNLITSDNFYLNENVLLTTLYSMIGILTVLLIIVILMFIYSVFVFDKDNSISKKMNKIFKKN